MNFAFLCKKNNTGSTVQKPNSSRYTIATSLGGGSFPGTVLVILTIPLQETYQTSQVLPKTQINYHLVELQV